MQTMHERVLSDVVLQKMKSSEWRHTLSDYSAGLSHGFYHGRDFIWQEFMQTANVTPEQAYVFAVIHAKISTGEVVVADLNVHAEPASDSAYHINQHSLTTGLRDLEPIGASCNPNTKWNARVYNGNYASNDGVLEWSDFAIFQKSRLCGDTVIADGEVWIQGRSVPLEIGYTKPSTTLMHLNSERGLARWPYGSQIIRIFVNVAEMKHRFPYRGLRPAQQNGGNGNVI